MLRCPKKACKVCKEWLILFTGMFTPMGKIEIQLPSGVLLSATALRLRRECLSIVHSF